MKVSVDTNILVRSIVLDDVRQGRAAAKLLTEADFVAVPTSALCEFVWVLRRTYKFARADLISAVETLVNALNVAVDRPAVDSGLAALKAGGDFADGVIAFEGSWLGADTFVSFDKIAVSLVAAQGQNARLL